MRVDSILHNLLYSVIGPHHTTIHGDDDNWCLIESAGIELDTCNLHRWMAGWMATHRLLIVLLMTPAAQLSDVESLILLVQ